MELASGGLVMPPVQKPPTRPPLPPNSILPGSAPQPLPAEVPAPAVASYFDRAAAAVDAVPQPPPLPLPQTASYFDRAAAAVGANEPPPNPTLASGGMVFRPLPTPVKKEEAPVNPTADQLRQRVGAKQWFLQQLGFDWTPTDEDIEEEAKSLPEDGSIVKYSIPDTVAVEKRPEKEPELSLDFEPFDPEDSDKWIEVASLLPPKASQQGPIPVETPRPKDVVPPKEGPGSASVNKGQQEEMEA